MKRRLIATIATLIFLSFAITIGTVRISAQQPTPTPSAPVPTPTSTPDLERRVYQLEVAYAQTIQTSTYTRNIAAAAGVLFTILVIFQGYAAGTQLRREGRALENRLEAEMQARSFEQTGVEQVSKVMSVVQQTLENRLEIESAGIQQVSSIMGIVQQTLESHLKTEERAREMVETVEEQLADALKGLKPLQELYSKLQDTIRKLRKDIEERAFQLAQISRHDFRRKTDDLNSFVDQFGTFTTEFETLEEEREGKRPQFSPRVLYIRGIAAHYANQPDIAKKYLDKVVGSRKPLSDEDQDACNRRVANAYYYLGLTQSNFGNYQPALNFFEKANELDPEARDFLTRIVTAEAYVMARDFDKAIDFITQVETGVLKTERDKDGRLLNFYLRLQSRAVLIKANIAILGREDNWHQKVQDDLLGPVYEADPQYYYATATLAQVYYDQGKHTKARELFLEAYETIERSGHLITVTEARSRILLLMVTGLCCKHGLEEDRWSKERLDSANGLLGSLPKMGLQTCTVFSILSKRNEDVGTIRNHIELIRDEGKVLL